MASFKEINQSKLKALFTLARKIETMSEKVLTHKSKTVSHLEYLNKSKADSFSHLLALMEDNRAFVRV